jgi:hypothetical protein
MKISVGKKKKKTCCLDVRFRRRRGCESDGGISSRVVLVPSHRVTNMLFLDEEIRWWPDGVSTANITLNMLILRIGRRRKNEKHSK